VTRDVQYLRHMADAAPRNAAYVKVGKEAFLAEPMRQDATIRQLEILGEAAKRVSQDVRDAHSDGPWRQTAGLRDVLIHQYMGVDLSTVWEVADGRIPAAVSVV
jgi:uncharacterized protein with HEPN domain